MTTSASQLYKKISTYDSFVSKEDIQKAYNLMKHKEEIFNRPRRQWFISKEEKRQLNENVMKKLKLIPEDGVKVKKDSKKG